MRAEAELRYPREACGFLIAQGKKAVFMPARNVAEGTDQFVIDHRDYAAAEDAGEIIAIWHSHPEAGGSPSEADLAGCEMTELPWLISAFRRTEQGFEHDEITVTQPSGFATPYVGRPYIFGTFDCYSLLADFYRREYGIRLDDFHHLRIPEWWRAGDDILERNWRSQGFVPVTDGTFQEGDALTFAFDSDIPNHVAMYVTGDIILHHMIHRLSRKETFGPSWMSRMKHHLRHISKC